MAINFVVKESAKDEVIEIVDWYNYQQIGLGERFYKELLFEFEKIQKKPTLYTYYKKDFRRAILTHFPYLIIFKVTEKEIVIYSIIYGGRNPELIKKRIN